MNTQEAIEVYHEAVKKMPEHYQPQSLYNMMGKFINILINFIYNFLVTFEKQIMLEFIIYVYTINAAKFCM